MDENPYPERNDFKMEKLINYFFIPALAVLIHERKNGNPSLQPSLRLLAVYMSYTAGLIPCTRVLTITASRLFHVNISAAKAKYTLFALMAAIVLPYVLALLKDHISLKTVKRGEKEHV